MTPNLQTAPAPGDPTLEEDGAAPEVLAWTPADPPPPTRTARLRHLLGLDRAIGFTLLARGWSSLSGLFTLRLIAKHLSLDEQGFYFTFGSLVALQIVFELGFSSVILQLASHEAAHLTIHPSGLITGDAIPHRRLASVLQRSIRWYAVASALMAATVIPVGIHFFNASARKHPDHPVAWLLPWIAVVVAAVFTFQIDPLFSFLEGCGFVPQVARTRFWQAFVGSLLAWTALLLGHGLFAPALIIAGQTIAGAAWLFTQRRLLADLFRVQTGDCRITLAEVWPFQWRIAISWLAGYFISQLFNPILFVFWGPAAAGQMGMSLTLMNAVSSVALSWVYTKAAPFGQMIARREFQRLDAIFFRALTQSVALCALGALALWLGDVYLYAHHSPYALRLLAPLPFAILLTVPVLNQVVASEALYLRAHKQEKFLVNSVVGAICVALSSCLLGRYYAALGMVSGYLTIAIVVGIGGGTFTFLKYRRLWHTPQEFARDDLA